MRCFEWGLGMLGWQSAVYHNFPPPSCLYSHKRQYTDFTLHSKTHLNHNSTDIQITFIPLDFFHNYTMAFNSVQHKIKTHSTTTKRISGHQYSFWDPFFYPTISFHLPPITHDRSSLPD